MRSRTVLLLAISIGCGLIAAFLASRQTPEPNITVLTARQHLAAGTPLTNLEALFEPQEMPRHVQLPPNYVSRFDQLKDVMKDHLLDRAMKPGELLTRTDLIDKAHMSLSKLLRPGFLGFAVKVTAESGGNHLHPDEYVKVISISKMAGGGKETHVLMKNIRVVAVDAAVDRAQGHAQTPNTVALEVTEEEGKKLRLAQEDGYLALALIAFADVAQLMDRKGEEATVKKEPIRAPESTVPVLVPREPLPSGADLSNYERDFIVKDLPRAQLDPSRLYFSSLAQLKDKAKDLVVLRALKADEPLSLDLLSAKRDEGAGFDMTIVGATTNSIIRWDSKSKGVPRRPTAP